VAQVVARSDSGFFLRLKVLGEDRPAVAKVKTQGVFF
jgi:hypothetical protein